MSKGLDGILKQLEPHPVEIGLGSLGLGSPAGRFVFGSALGAVVVWAVRPGVSFDETGAARQFTLFAAPGEDSTALPWYFLALLPGILFAVFI